MTFGGDGGIWKLIRKPRQDEADEPVRRAFDTGISFFATADVYSAGRPEKTYGEAIRGTRLPRDVIIVATEVFRRGSMLVGDEATDDKKAEAERRENRPECFRRFSRASL